MVTSQCWAISTLSPPLKLKLQEIRKAAYTGCYALHDIKARFPGLITRKPSSFWTSFAVCGTSKART